MGETRECWVPGSENHTGKSSQPEKATVAAAHGTRAERLSSKALKITLKILSLF